MSPARALLTENLLRAIIQASADSSYSHLHIKRILQTNDWVYCMLSLRTVRGPVYMQATVHTVKSCYPYHSCS